MYKLPDNQKTILFEHSFGGNLNPENRWIWLAHLLPWNAGKKDEAIKLITYFAYDRAVEWNKEWLKLGEHLLGTYALGYRNFKTTGYPEEWNDFIGYGPLER